MSEKRSNKTPTKRSPVVESNTKLINLDKKIDARIFLRPLDEDSPASRFQKPSIINSTTSKKVNDSYNSAIVNPKSKPGDFSHSLNHALVDVNEIGNRSRGTPITDDEMPRYQNLGADRERAINGIQHSSSPMGDQTGSPDPYQKKFPYAVGFQGTDLDTKISYNLFKKSTKKLFPIAKLTAPEEPKTSNVGYESEDNNIYSSNMIKSNSMQKVIEKPFYGAGKSPRVLVNKKYRKYRKETEATQAARLSLPFVDACPNDRVNYKLPALGRNNMYKEEEPYGDTSIYAITGPLDKKAAESQAVKIVRRIAQTIVRTEEKMPEPVFGPLIISGFKKDLKSNRYKIIRNGGANVKGFSTKINPDEIGNFETEGSDEELVRNYKHGLNKFNSPTKTNHQVEEDFEEEERANTLEIEENMEAKAKKLVPRQKRLPPNRPLAEKTDNAVKFPNIGTNKLTKKTKAGAIAGQKQLEVVDAGYARKLEAYKEFLARMSFSFNLQIKTPEKLQAPYKFYIGKGNNHMLIRALMKTRWWWAQTDSKNPKEINFMWTQWRNKKFIESLQSLEQQGYGNSKDSEQGQEGFDESRKGLITDSYKRLFNQKEIKIMEENPEAFKNGPSSKQYEEMCRKEGGIQVKEVTEPQSKRICNHIEDNFHLANKKALLINMKSYYGSINEDVFKHLPLTFHIKNGLEDEEFKRFVECYKQREKEIQEQETEEKGKSSKKARNIWIVKPGENTNKGKGISMVNDLEEIKGLVGGKSSKASRTYLIQLYLDRPLLYNKRKFDIRCYMLISCINGVYKGYWYQEGYFRTSSKEFTVKNIANKQIHLTNDAIQKKYDDYGKWESGNKVSYAEFERYLETTYGSACDFYKHIYPQMKQSATDTIRAVYGTVDPHKRENTFEVFGLDFMIDSSFRVWLIEVNTNPDICIPAPKLGILIPNMVENALRLTIDPIYPPPSEIPAKKPPVPENLLENNKFELVFDEREEGHLLRKTLKARQEGLKALSAEDQEGEEESEDDAKD